MATKVTRNNRREGVKFGANGYLSLSDNEIDVSSGDLTIDVAGGDIDIDAANIKLDATKKMYLDGGSDTYIVGEPVIADTMQLVVGGTAMINLQEGVSNVININDSNLCLDSTYKLFFDSTAVGHTYIRESSDDILDIYVGGDKMLSLDETVDTGVTSLIGTLKIKEQADKSTETAGYGQLWIKDSSPNELCFTDDADTDIFGIGKYHYETKFIAYYASGTSAYLPMNGYILEQTSTTGKNEYLAFLAPYNGTIQKVGFRSEIAQDGNLSFRVLEATDGTEVPGTLIFRNETTVDIADDTYQELDMTGPGIGSDYSPLTKGRIYMIFLSTPSIPYDTNINIVFKWDITS